MELQVVCSRETQDQANLKVDKFLSVVGAGLFERERPKSTNAILEWLFVASCAER